MSNHALANDVSAGTGRWSCGALVADSLERHGVEVLFGIPATHTLALYDFLARSPIRHVTPRHEQGAGYAADGYARATGRPGVCIVTTGPALLNAAAAAGTAYHDSIPMLLISPGMAAERNGHDTGFLHEVKNQSAALDNIVAWSRRAESVADVGLAIADAFEHFATKRPRPVHIEIPLDVLNGSDEVSSVPTYIPHPPPAPDRRQLDAALGLLRAARTPAMLIGGGAIDAGDAVIALAERLDAVIVTTCNAKGVVPDSHPLSIGTSLRLEPARSLLSESDVVVAIGTEIAESDLWVGRLEFEGALVRVDVDEEQLQKNARASAPILGRADVVARELVRELGPADGRAPQNGAARASAVRDVLQVAQEVDGAPFAELHRELRKVLADDAIVAGDSAQVCYYGTVHYFSMPWPRQFLYPAGFATLGYGLPAAIGAKLAFPEREVVSLLGDGGLMFTVNEIATAAENRLGLPIIVYNNGGYKEIKDEMIARGSQPLGVDLPPPDFVGLARALGGDGVRLTDLTGFGDAVRSALSADVPTLIEVLA